MGPKSASTVLTAGEEAIAAAQLSEHLPALLLAYKHAKRLKRLRGLTPHEFVCAQWQTNATIFTQDPTQLTLGLYK